VAVASAVVAALVLAALFASVTVVAGRATRALRSLNPLVLLDAGDGDPTSRVVEVAEVIDGDTISVRVEGHTHTVRLLGIDTPETKDPRRPVQCYGPEATRRATELLPPGTEVRLEPDVERRDRYDRVLAYVYRVPDGLFVNLELARGGYADVLTYPPNVSHTAELSAAVAEARREQRGLWQACGGPGRPG